MKVRDLAGSVLLVLAASGFAFYLAASDLSSVQGPGRSAPEAAVLVNNDISDLHCGNIELAKRVCRNFPLREIIALGESERAPARREVLGALADLQKRGLRVGLLYLTGHGSLIHSAELPNGEACLMLKDAPLTSEDIAGQVGEGPCVIYLDICFAPDFVDRLAERLQGQFRVLTDKNPAEPQKSCRGVSGKFWEAVERTAAGGSLWDSALIAWRETSPGGVWKPIDNKPISSDQKKGIVFHPRLSNTKTETGDR